MNERFGRSDYRFLAVCLTLLAVATWFSVRNFYRAFPEASIDFRVSRPEGETLASAFLAGRGYDTANYRRAASFSYDDNAKTFLEREAGPERANELLGARIRLWRWSYRWFRPLQKEEFRVDITPHGDLAGFSHELPEDAARPEIDAAQARRLAEEFLSASLRRDPSALDFIEVSEAARPHRTDRTFTWEARDFHLKDATYRFAVTLLGNEVGGYSEYLKIPEQWSRDYRRLRSKNETASTVDLVFMSGLVIGLIVVIVLRVRGHDIRWRRAATVGVIGMALAFLSQLNQMPLQEFEYPTTDSYSSFIMRQILNAIIGALGAGGLLFVLTAGAEPLYREMFPGQVSLGNQFRPAALRTKRFFLGAVLGISLTGIFVAYQTAFYMIAYQHGAWSPADVPYSDLLNTRLPWAFVLFGGFLPAVSEEFLFRMFAIPFLRKVTRSIAAALLLAGFIWGFGHAGYPQQPFYIRGVEVGMGGVVLGMVMLRWGILPTLVWHYSVDAMYTAMLLLRSQNLYLRLSGAVSAGIVLLPLVIALVAYWRNGGFAPAEGLLNGEEGSQAPPPEPAPPPADAERTARRWLPLSGRARIAALAILAAGIAALLIPTEHFGEKPTYRVPEAQALTASDAFLRDQGLDPSAYMHVIAPAVHWGGADELAGKYFLERRPLPAASSMFERFRPIQHWSVRYFKPLSQDEVIATVHPETGKVMGFHHTLPEDQAGDDLPESGARPIAAAFASRFGWDAGTMDLKENSSDRKKARRDYTFVWEARAGDPRNLEEARFRVETQVDGSIPVSARGFWKLPEDFERGRERQNFLSIASAVLRIAVFAGGLVAAVWMLIHAIRRGDVGWRPALRLGIPAALLIAAGPALSMHLLLQNYPTAIPLETFRATTVMAVLLSVVFGFVMMAAAVALVTALFPDALSAFLPENRRALARDAALAVVAGTGLGLIVHQAGGLLDSRFHAQALLSPDAPTLIASLAPSIAAAANSLRGILLSAAVIATVVLVFRGLRRSWMRAALPILLAGALLSSDVRTPGEFALQYGMSLMTVAAAFVFCRYFARDNYLGYAVALWIFSLREPLAELYGSPRQPHFWILLAILAAGLLWALIPLPKRPYPEPGR
jgi:membrane protease YdiL (CAAX protease family)